MYEFIQTSFVDNSSATTGMSSNKWACNSTYDKLYLLSYSEAKLYFNSADDRKTYATDYAISKRTINYESGCYWWLRSPHVSQYDSNDARYVKGVMGEISGGWSTNHNGMGFGIRISMNIIL